MAIAIRATKLAVKAKLPWGRRTRCNTPNVTITGVQLPVYLTVAAAPIVRAGISLSATFPDHRFSMEQSFGDIIACESQPGYKLGLVCNAGCRGLIHDTLVRWVQHDETHHPVLTVKGSGGTVLAVGVQGGLRGSQGD